MNRSNALARARPEEVGLSAERLDRLSANFRDEIDRERLPGAVVLVARDGRIAHFEAIGARDPAGAAAMSEDTIFRIYSMTKPVVSVAAMMLVEQGALMITDPVERYLPEFAHQSVAVLRDGRVETEPARRATTIQDLLRHTAGLTYEFLGDDPVQAMYRRASVGDRAITATQLCQRLAKIPLMHHPGSAFAYSRSTDVLGRVLEVVSGHSLGKLLNERIFEPLRMSDTGFRVPEPDRPRLAQPFALDPDGGGAVQLFDPAAPAALESGGGGLMSTATDYARFLQMLLDGGTLDGERLLSRKTIEFMTADHLGAIPLSGDLLSPGYGFGLGFAVRLAGGLAPTPGSVGQYHWGGLAGTAFWVDPAERLFAIMLIQAPNQREYYRLLFRNLVYAAFDD